ncbi:MAG: glycosyltransferase family 4 protein [Candidatus Helarchaeota archaeon]
MSYKKIIYPIIGRFPSEKAKTIQILRTTSWLFQKNCDLILIFPHRKSQIIKIKDKKKILRFYNIKKLPPVIELPNIDLFHSKYQRFAWYIHIITYILVLIPYIFSLKPKKYKYFLLRDWELLYFFSFLKRIYKMKIIFELHRIPITFKIIKQKLISKADGIIVISENIRKFMQRFARNKNISVIPDAFDPVKLKNEQLIISNIKKKFNLKPKSEIIIYTGHLYKYKNIEFLIQAMKYVKNKNIILLIIGGRHDDLNRIKKYINDLGLDNIITTGFVPPYLIPYFHKLSKIGIITSNSKIKDFHSESPLKLFEYMGAKLPIIAMKDISIEYIIKDGFNGIIVPDDNPEILAKKIEFLIENPNIANKIAENAYKIAMDKYTFKKRAENILRFIKSISQNKKNR